MHKSSDSQTPITWFTFGLAVILAATIVLLITSPSIAYTADIEGEPAAQRQSRDPQTGTGSREATPLMFKAREVLAERLSVTPDDLVFVSQEAVRWPDTSLGCPEPGHMYAKVIVPGYRFTFTYDGSSYEVHTARETGIGSHQPPVSCEGGRAYPA